MIFLVGQYNYTYYHSINKKTINADYSALTEKIETDPKAPKVKVNDRVRILSIRIFLVKVAQWKLVKGVIYYLCCFEN